MIDKIDQHCRYIRVEEDQVVVSAEDDVDKVLFLLAGELRLSVYTRGGKIVALRNAVPGTILCDGAFAVNGRYAYTVEAAKPSMLASINVVVFMDCIRTEPAFLRAVLRQLVCRQTLLTEQVVELSTLSMQARLHKEILRLCRENMDIDGSATVQPAPTHSEFARRIGAQREAVSREMSHLQQLGIIVRREAGTLHVPSVTPLIELQITLEE